MRSTSHIDPVPLQLITLVLGLAKLYYIKFINVQDKLNMRQLFGQGNKVDFVRLRRTSVRIYTPPVFCVSISDGLRPEISYTMIIS
jgi:hypothetical protein